MNSGSSVAPHILVLAALLSLTWGAYLAYTISQYRYAVYRHKQDSKVYPRGRIVREFRRMVVAMCLWMFVFSFVFRTICVLLGVAESTVGLVVFFALTGSNLVGSLYAVVSLWFDDD